MIKQWYAKELSKLTQVSVRTLHHYDKIGLLEPSMRLPNGYRLYSEKDLLKLQQIIALKFFGFELSQIKILLVKQNDVVDNFEMQAKFLQEKAQTLQEASMILKQITANCNRDRSISWENIIQLIEVYNMTQQLEHAWVKEIFTPDELKQYAEFEENLKSRFSTAEKTLFETNWFKLMEEIKNNLQHEPTSKIGIELGKASMDIINGLYGKEYANLRAIKWQKGFKEGKGLKEHGLTPEIVTWLDQALTSYWMQRIYGVLAEVGKIPSAELLLLWNEVMDDMYGEDTESKMAIFDAILLDDKVSLDAKKWLKSVFNL